jgi:histidyl-tRNA synthetase
VVILGENEIQKNVAAVKDMKNGTQDTIPLGDLEKAILEKIKS